MSLLESYEVSYAQNREDLIINAFFGDVKHGFYVDVGANHPEEDSVTKYFYDKGWTGINIEPSPKLFKELTAKRKRDINVQCGIAQKDGELKFREYMNHGLSTFSSEIKKTYEQTKNKKTATYNEYVVTVKPLRTVLEEAAPEHIHFLKIDVEGFEYDVLASNDWDKYRPELLCIEANHIVKDWHDILQKAGYTLVFNDGLNEYFLAKEALHRKDLFDYAESIILGKQIITPGLANLIKDYEHTREIANKSQKYVAEIGRLEFKNANLQTQVNKLQAEIARNKGLRRQFRDLYTELDSYILRTLDRRGHARKTYKAKTVPYIDTKGLDKLSSQELLDIAKTYDAQAYFHFRSPKSGLKLRYRVASKAYRTSRDITKKVVKKSYHLAKKVRG